MSDVYHPASVPLSTDHPPIFCTDLTSTIALKAPCRVWGIRYVPCTWNCASERLVF
jgi:hypothetical protein